MNTLFITGTDAAVGKTLVSCALLQSLAQKQICAAGFKPIAKGARITPEGLRNRDAEQLQQASGMPLSYSQINPVILTENETGNSAGFSVDYALLNQRLTALQSQADYVIVDGTGGWRSLLDEQPLSAWVQQNQLPVILVVGIKEGCISHTLLTAEAIAQDGLRLVAWVANRINPGLNHYTEIIDVLRSRLAAPLLGELPYLSRAAERDLTPYLNLSALSDPLPQSRRA